jgi:hypothetical protein
MERFYKRKAPEADSHNNVGNSSHDDINWEEEIKYDPRLRKLIDDYHPNQRESEKKVLGEWTISALHMQFSIFRNRRKHEKIYSRMV